MAQLQREVADLLTLYVGVRERDVAAAPPQVAIGNMTVAINPANAGRARLFVTGASLRDAFVLQVALTLASEDSTRLERCPETACRNRLFVKRGRRQYCSTTCERRAAKRRSRRIGKEKEKARQRRKYVNRKIRRAKRR